MGEGHSKLNMLVDSFGSQDIKKQNKKNIQKYLTASFFKIYVLIMPDILQNIFIRLGVMSIL